MECAMRLGTLVVAATALAGAAGAGNALAGVPEEASVTVLRGSSAPPPPPEPAQPAVVVLREVVYQPVYSYNPGYSYPSFYGSSYFVRSYFPRFQPPAAPVMPAPVANGWPLLGGLAPMRR
jgi:hypothetical protein